MNTTKESDEIRQLRDNLLEALKWAVDFIGNKCEAENHAQVREYKKAVAAIAKAEERSMSKQIKPRFDAMPYGTHWSFADASCEEDDYNFRIEFPEQTPEEYEAEVIRLIAAAPELLEACKMMVEAMHRYEMDAEGDKTIEHKKIMKQAVAAIAKAEGKQ